MPRLFIAIDVPPEARETLVALATELPGARWTPPDNLHLTLRFLGQIDPGEVATLQVSLRAVRTASFTLALLSVGIFPPATARKPARILWAGVNPAPPVVVLKKAIDDVLGPDAETAERGFSPHVTLARLSGEARDPLQRFLDRHSALTSRSWNVDRFHLFASTLGQDRARHEIVETFALS